MPRPLRIEYPNAFYHVMNRGLEKKPIFHSEHHYISFLDLFKEMSTKYKAKIHAYCLMDNHYHLLLSTPLSNLNKAMRHLNGIYTQRFNRSVKRDGPLFRGRYKSILVEAEQYLLQVSRYIHLNPVEANIVNYPQQYLWSSYRAYFNDNNVSNWLDQTVILAYFKNRQHYHSFIQQGIDAETEKFYSRKRISPIIGSQQFIKSKIDQLENTKKEESLHEIKSTYPFPSLQRIFEITAEYFQINSESLKNNRRGKENLPKFMAITLSHCVFGYQHNEISKFLNIKTSSSSSQISRFKKNLKNKKLNNDYHAVIKLIQHTI